MIANIIFRIYQPLWHWTCPTQPCQWYANRIWSIEAEFLLCSVLTKERSHSKDSRRHRPCQSHSEHTSQNRKRSMVLRDDYLWF